MTQAPDVLRIYSAPELQEYEIRIGPNLYGMWEEDLLSRLTRDERAQAGAVTLNTPLVGATRHPLEFYSDPAERQVFLPIASVKFFDDLALAFSYYGNIGRDAGVISGYVGVLRFRPQDISGSPLDTLGVPRSATQDPQVDLTAQKILKSTVFFVAAHEYAHVMFQHRNYSAITAQQAQQQEGQADAFALDVLRRIGVAPVGLAFFFLIASRLEATPGDFATLADYEEFLQQRATHPVNSLRLLEVATNLENNAGAFSRLQANPALWVGRLQGDAAKLREIAQTLDDRRMRLFMAERARTADVAALRLSGRN
jgi:hypothetical protein